MSFYNFRKESSERSDAYNWAKQILINKTDYHYDSIEGCNENNSNKVTLLMERARIDVNEQRESTQETFDQIKSLEGDSLIRKINFAHAFGINLTYYLYNDEKQLVWMFEILSMNECRFVRKFDSFKIFSAWIQEQKGWKSTKPYRERKDLPYFDRVLRQYGCAWPTNIDCFISDMNNQPIAILEFQNAKKTKVRDHCNNKHFLCEIRTVDDFGKIHFNDDLRRWQSQEILRVQSGLRLFVITWSQTEETSILKEIRKIVFPLYPNHSSEEMKEILHRFTISPRGSEEHVETWNLILNNFKSYTFQFNGQNMLQRFNQPPLHMHGEMTAPLLYYSYKELLSLRNDLPKKFIELISNKRK